MDNIITVYNEDARERLKAGIDKLTRAVSSTLGPFGSTVIISAPDGIGLPKITKDGVSVAKVFQSQDEIENMGIQLIKNVAELTDYSVGDGTTTATILANGLIEVGFALLSKGYNSNQIKEDLSSLLESSKEVLSTIKREVNEENVIDVIEKVAITSSNHDSEIYENVTNAYSKVGLDGFVNIVDSRTDKTYSHKKEGFIFGNKKIEKEFLGEKNIRNIKNANILVCNTEIVGIDQIAHIITYFQGKKDSFKKNLVLVCRDIKKDALNLLLMNLDKINILPIRILGFEEDVNVRLEDVAESCGAKFINESIGMSLKSISTKEDLEACLGYAEEVVAEQKQTTLLGGEKSDNFESYVQRLENETKKLDGFEKSKMINRIQKLKSKISVIYVGAKSESEMQEKKDRMIDASRAVASLKEGFLPGGGSALFKTSIVLEKVSNNPFIEALRAPILTIILNSENDFSTKYYSNKLKSVESRHDYNFYNVKTKEVEDAYEASVIDPYMVTESALSNAISIASVILTTSCAIYRVEDEKKKNNGFF